MINQVHKGIIIKIIKVRKVTKPIVNRDENEMHDYLKFLHHTYTVDGRHDIASLILGPNHLQH